MHTMNVTLPESNGKYITLSEGMSLGQIAIAIVQAKQRKQKRPAA